MHFQRICFSSVGYTLVSWFPNLEGPLVWVPFFILFSESLFAGLTRVSEIPLFYNKFNPPLKELYASFLGLFAHPSSLLPFALRVISWTFWFPSSLMFLMSFPSSCWVIVPNYKFWCVCYPMVLYSMLSSEGFNNPFLVIIVDGSSVLLALSA